MSRPHRAVWSGIVLLGFLLIGLVGCTPGRPSPVETSSAPADNIGAAIDAAQADEVSGLHELRAVLVNVNGEMVAERYYGTGSKAGRRFT